MECKHAEDLLSAQLDGALDAAQSAALAAHITGCPACQALAGQMAALPAQLSEFAERFRAPGHLRTRILLDLDRSRAAAPSHHSLAQPALVGMPWRWISGGAAVLGSCALIASLSLYLGQPGAGQRLEQEIVSSHYRSLMANHLSDVISTDQHTVKPWFTGKLDFAPRVVDLTAQGFALAGGRLDYLDQHPVAALVYRHRQHVINLFTWPTASKVDSQAGAGSLQGFQTLHWDRDGMRYWAVSDVSAHDLEQFRQLLVQAPD